MPPRTGTRATSEHMKSVPTVDRKQGTSELPDSAFQVEAYTREMNVDRRDMSGMYGPKTLPAAIEKEMARHDKMMRSTKAGPVQCGH